MKQGVKMCINTQTPLVQFMQPREKALEFPRSSIPDLSSMVEDVDYSYSTGGVTRMVFPLIKRMLKDGFLADAHWVSLNPSGPETIRADGMMLHHISLEKERLSSYGKVKETMWGTIHGTGGLDGTSPSRTEDMFWTDDYSEYAYYNRLSAELITKLDKKYDFDLFYVHDFQQLAVGQMLGTLKPKIFRWHIPFDDSMIPEQWKEKLSSYFNSYDVIIVSSERYLESVKSFGYTGDVRKLYPFVDQTEFRHPSAEEVNLISSKLGIQDDDEVILVVARMDPMKGQDRAILAMASIAQRFPKLKLVLVGNGSFSGSRQGLGLSKSAKWKAELESLAKRQGVQDRVILAGHLTQEELDAMYERSAFTILPSVKEGFGLVAVESWVHHRACLVTERAGVAEIVREGKNGLVVNPDDTKRFSQRIYRLLRDRELTQKLAEAGNKTARICSIEEGLKTETRIISELVD